MKKNGFYLEVLIYLGVIVGFFFLLMPVSTQANVTGVTFQTFNPTSSQNDHLTVHSSQSLRAKNWRWHFYGGMSADNFSVYEPPVTDQKKAVMNDQLVFADLGLGYGLRPNWELGFHAPMNLKHSFEPASFGQKVAHRGITTLHTQIKYTGRSRLDESSGEKGWGVVASVDLPNINQDGFLGQRPQPINTLEFFYDEGSEVKSYAVNVGYRLRIKGEPYADAPVLPLDDQLIFSVGYQTQLRRKKQWSWLAEVYGSYPVNGDELNKPLDHASLEMMLGLRGGAQKSRRWTVAAGGGLLPGSMNPQWRVMVGGIWDFQWGKTAPPKDILTTTPPIQGADDGIFDPFLFAAAKTPPEDSDRDGIKEDLDMCPQSPRGVKVDSEGCPYDSDDDSIPDYADKCPKTPADEVVNASGCPTLLDPKK